MTSLSEKLYYYVNDGLPLNVLALLEEFSDDVRTKLLHQEYTSEIGDTCSLLIIASMRGHSKLVSMFCNSLHVNLEQTGTVKVDNTLVEGATALWVAAANGELGVIKILVSAGADVNHTTSTQSSPVRAACFYGRLDIVVYLVEHGADLSIKNKFNSSCLMIAAYKGFVDIVEYLLTQNVDIDEVAHCGSSALHYAAECGHLKIVEILLINGAKIFPNCHGMTPLSAAAERTKAEVVTYFFGCGQICKKDKIDALELIGASFANDKENYSVQACYELLHKAMLLRFEDPCDLIFKPTTVLNPAYGNKKECETLEELESIEDNSEAIHMESLIIRERILTPFNPDVSHAVVFRGAVYADHMKFEKCILLWLHALHLQRTNALPITKDLLRFSQVFSQMYCCKVPIDPHDVKLVLNAALYEITELKKRIENQAKDAADPSLLDEMESMLIHTIYIIVIVCKIIATISEDEQYELKKLIHKIIKVGATTKNGYTMLHLCVDSDTPVDSFHTEDVCQFPCSLTANFLIRLGADVNARDNCRNTPLHIIVGYNKPISDFMTLFVIIARLIEFGAHTDAVNCKGETPKDVASTGVAEILLQHLSTLSLKCLAARAVKNYGLQYSGVVPKDLESFIEMHGNGTCDDPKDDDETTNNGNYCKIAHGSGSSNNNSSVSNSNSTSSGSSSIRDKSTVSL